MECEHHIYRWVNLNANAHENKFVQKSDPCVSLFL